MTIKMNVLSLNIGNVGVIAADYVGYLSCGIVFCNVSCLSLGASDHDVRVWWVQTNIRNQHL